MGKQHKHQKRTSLASEKTAAGQYGRLSPRSGADARRPGDVEWPHLLLEDKITKSERYYVTSKIWNKISKEASLRGRIPCVRVTVDYWPPVVVMRPDEFKELLLHSPEVFYPEEGLEYSRGSSIPITSNVLEKLVRGYPCTEVETPNGLWVICLWSSFEQINNRYAEACQGETPG